MLWDRLATVPFLFPEKETFYAFAYLFFLSFYLLISKLDYILTRLNRVDNTKLKFFLFFYIFFDENTVFPL